MLVLRSSSLIALVDPAHGAPTGPSQTGDLVEPGAGQTLAAGRSSNDRFGSQLESEPQPFAIGDRVGVIAAFMPRHVGSIDHIDAGQPVHSADGFPAGDHQSKRVTLLGTHGFAILGVGHQSVIHSLTQRDAHGVLVGFIPFGHYPSCPSLDAALLEQYRQQHPRPFTAAGSSVYGPDFECTFNRDDVGRATYSGLDGLRAAMLDWLSPWESYYPAVEDVIDAGDGRVVVLTRDHARPKEARRRNALRMD